MKTNLFTINRKGSTVNNYYRVLHFFLLTFFLTGCNQINQSTQINEPLTTNNPLAMYTVTSTLIPILLTTETPSPAITQYLTITLDPESIQKTIQPLLQDPFNCDVPCFMGIIPSKTSLEKVKVFFSPFGFQQTEGIGQNVGEDYYSVDYENSIGYDSSVFFAASDNIVQTIVIMPDISRQIEGRPREWIAYSPEMLIKKFGQPSRVQIGLDWWPNMHNTISMIMYFDHLDFIALYSGDNMITGDPSSQKLCPITDPFNHIRFWMGNNPPNPPSFETVPLEVATSLTIEQFTNLMIGDTENVCFTLNADAFQ
jgi:hypothetical protein